MTPVDLLLFCPQCTRQHIDKPFGDWTNPPHRSHLCAYCEYVWRPADVPTNGVARISSVGKDDGDPTPGDTFRLQKAILRWAATTFGPSALHVEERACRLIEEAIEVGQSAGLDKRIVTRLAERVYSRLPGESFQEIGGTFVSLAAMAECLGVSLMDEGVREFARVLSTPRETFKAKHEAKVVAGLADLRSQPFGSNHE